MCSPALVCGALVALRAELLQPVRGWRGSGGDALETGVIVGRVPS